MKRIRNDYCWNIMKDWQEAQKMGFTKNHDFLCGNNEENLRNLIELAVNDCFPLQIVCVSINGDKYTMTDSLMRRFLQFINNEIPIIDKDKRDIFFKELPKEKQNRILEAKVNSVWIRMEQTEKLGI